METTATPTTRLVDCWRRAEAWGTSPLRVKQGGHRLLDRLPMEQLEGQTRPTCSHQISEVGVVGHHDLETTGQALTDEHQFLDMVVELQLGGRKPTLESQRKQMDV
jgi:hypothetical protein